MNHIEVYFPRNTSKFLGNSVRKMAAKALKALDKDGLFLKIFLVGDRAMKYLNSKFVGKNKTTDILSFEEPPNFPHPEVRTRRKRSKNVQIKAIGEIYLNTDLLKKMPGLSKRKKQGYFIGKYTLPRLLMHGLLHLLGYNHKRKSDRMKMERKEEWLIGKLVS